MPGLLSAVASRLSKQRNFNTLKHGIRCIVLAYASRYFEHVGSYSHLGNAWSAANQFARDKKLKQSKVGAFELYKNDPKDTTAADLRTEIFLPLK